MKSRLIWYSAAIVGTCMTATLGMFVREISPGNDFAITFGRFAVGFICLASLRLPTRKDQGERNIRLSWALIGAGIAMPLFVVCYIKAILAGTFASAAFLLYVGPLIASLLAAVWVGEGFTRLNGLLLGGALLGTLLITEFKLPQESEQVESLVYGLLSGVFYGLFLFLNNSKVQGQAASLTSTFYQFLCAALVMLPLVIIAGVNLTRDDLFWIAAIGIIHGFVALTLMIASLGHLKTIEYGTISYGEPVVAALIGVVGYHESLTALQIIGCCAVFVAGIMRVFIKETPST